jgi:SAM-dependent methyltransferase
MRNPSIEGSAAPQHPPAAVLAAARGAVSLPPAMSSLDGYVMGRSPEEYERLRDQARMWEPETARLLDRAGLARGERCLDVGCGPGETMRLMAERVGPGGAVTGIDVDATLGAQAIRALHAGRHRQCRFEPVDVQVDATLPGAPFDLVFARLLLLHVDDPAAVLRRLWEWVAPGGRLVVQEYDLLIGQVVPELEVVEEFRRVALGTYHGSGRPIRLGLHLPALHAQAGVGAPDGMDAAVRVDLLPALAPMYEAVYRSVLPAALSLGLTTEDESARWFEAFAREAGGADGHAALWPPLIGTWKRKDG